MEYSQNLPDLVRGILVRQKGPPPQGVVWFVVTLLIHTHPLWAPAVQRWWIRTYTVGDSGNCVHYFDGIPPRFRHIVARGPLSSSRLGRRWRCQPHSTGHFGRTNPRIGPRQGPAACPENQLPKAGNAFAKRSLTRGSSKRERWRTGASHRRFRAPPLNASHKIRN